MVLPCGGAADLVVNRIRRFQLHRLCDRYPPDVATRSITLPTDRRNSSTRRPAKGTRRDSSNWPGDTSLYHLDMTTRREVRLTRVQLAKEEGALRELKRGADIGGLGNASTARDIEHSEREVEQLRAKLKRLKGRV